MKAVVTGGAGFIGSHLVRHLHRERGWEVVVVDDLSTGDARRTENLPDGIRFENMDVLDTDRLRHACRGAAALFHQAALASVPYSVEHPVHSCRVNAEGVLSALEAARQAGVPRVVYAASSAVYGADPTPAKPETLPATPLSPYGVAKYAGELYASVYAGLHRMHVVSLRYFNIFGPGQPPDSPYAAVIPLFMDAVRRGQRPQIHGDGTQTRDFTFVENVVAANWQACHAGAEASGKSFNIGCGEAITIRDLWDGIARVSGTRVEPEFVPRREGDVPHSRADISLARAVLGYAPGVGWREGVDRTWAWFAAGCPA